MVTATAVSEQVMQTSSWHSGTTGSGPCARPVELTVTQPGPDRYHASGSLLQSAFGIKPYSAFLGTLKVRDEVSFEADVDMTAAAAATP
jgi:hypothetical protein